MTEVIPINAKATQEAMADKTFPRASPLPLLDAPLDDLATYLRPDSWEERKNYLEAMMVDSIEGLMTQLDQGQSEEVFCCVLDGCLVALHIKIGRLLNAWGATEPADRHAAALFALSPSRAHRSALAKWMPGGETSPPMERELFEPGNGLMVFRNMSLAIRPGLAECWRAETGEG